MATFTNQNQNQTTFTNQEKGDKSLTWNEAIFSWNDARGTWNNQRTVYANQGKNTTTYQNQTQN